jgi:hypothetical protein
MAVRTYVRTLCTPIWTNFPSTLHRYLRRYCLCAKRRRRTGKRNRNDCPTQVNICLHRQICEDNISRRSRFYSEQYFGLRRPFDSPTRWDLSALTNMSKNLIMSVNSPHNDEMSWFLWGTEWVFKHYLDELLIHRYRTSWSSGKHSCFVFGRSRVQVSARLPAIVMFHGFPQFREANAEILP